MQFLEREREAVGIQYPRDRSLQIDPKTTKDVISEVRIKIQNKQYTNQNTSVRDFDYTTSVYEYNY